MPPAKKGSTQGMEDNFKRAVTEMLVLSLLDREDMHAVQITQNLEVRVCFEHGFPIYALLPAD